MGKGMQPQGQEWSTGECGPWLRQEAQLRCRAQQHPPWKGAEGPQKWMRGGQEAQVG